jgi:hypothetical protein
MIFALATRLRHRKCDRSKEKYEIYEFMGGDGNLWVMALVKIVGSMRAGKLVKFSRSDSDKRVVQEFINK